MNNDILSKRQNERKNGVKSLKGQKMMNETKMAKKRII